tara:strand:+ start:25510 stop:27165 length:1656 start_codon:yes stop_codon:yes gene_type:complete
VSQKTYEAIVVGSGATGGVAALTLANAGINVLVIDSGTNFSAGKAIGSEPCNTYRRLDGIIKGEYKNQSQHPGFWKANPLLYANEKENIYLYPKNRPFLLTQGRQVGGRSLTWGGITLRLSDYDLLAAKHDGHGQSWPIQYSDLASHYSFLENYFGVHGHKDGLDQLPDGNYLEYYPFTDSEKYFSNKVQNTLGYPLIHSRGFGPSNSNIKKDWPRSSSPGSTLKNALNTGLVELISEHLVERIILNKSQDKARGIISVNKKNGNKELFKSNLIILCASTIQSLRILLSSEENNIEKGFIDSSNILGCNLMDHVSTCRFFKLPKFKTARDVNISKDKKTLSGAGSFFIPLGNKTSNYEKVDFIRGYGIWGGIDRFDIPKYLKKDPDSEIGFLIGHGEVLPCKDNKITLTKEKDKWGVAIPHINFIWGENEKKMVKHMNSTIEKAINCAQGEIKPIKELINLPFINTVLDNAIATRSECPPPGYYIHEVGGAPMGFTKETSVVDRWNRLWNCKNVLVVDGACWPTSAWQSPTLTMMAITRRACLKAIEDQKS